MLVKEKVKEVTSGIKEKGKRNGKKKWLRIGLIVLLVLAILFTVLRFVLPKEEKNSTAVISAQAVTRGDVINYLTGSGMIEAMDSYDIVAKVQGDILSSPFEEGQIVQKDDVLYTFDSEDARQSLRSQQNSYDSQKISYDTEQKKWEKFTLTAPVSGYVKDIDATLRIGDDVNNGMRLATVNAKEAEVTLPFAASAKDLISVGTSVQLSSSKYMTNDLYGTVSAVGGVYAGSFDVTIRFTNPGQMEEGDVLGARVGNVQSSGVGKCRLAHVIEAEISGELASVCVKNGDFVQKGDVLFTLDDEDTKNDLRKSQINFDNAGISLQKAYDTLDNYTILSPITGTVIQKNYKAGDTLGNSANAAVLATIADISKMKFTINVDELDISGVQLGQKVEVTADAISGTVFAGEITKIIQQGSGTSGVTTYPVEVTIAEPGALKIGMNVTATIQMEAAQDVVKVPLEAVSMRGGKTYVHVLKKDIQQKVFGAAVKTQMPPKGEMPAKGEFAQKGEMPDAPSAKGKEETKEEYTFTEDDFEMCEVKTGVSSDAEIEILSGVEVGAYVKTVQTISNRTNMGFGGMSGMMGGGMSSGGMRPSGMGGMSGMGSGTSNFGASRTGMQSGGR